MNGRRPGIRWMIICIVLAVMLLGTLMTGCYDQRIGSNPGNPETANSGTQEEVQKDEKTEDSTGNSSNSGGSEETATAENEQSTAPAENGQTTAPAENNQSTAPAENEQSTEQSAERKDMVISWDESWQFADYSKIHSSQVTLYRSRKPGKNITVALNAGHGTTGGSSVKTLCHPDKTPKLVTGSTKSGETMAAAVSEGTTMLDGSPEREVTLALALVMKEDLLDAGYDVLMIRETDDVQLDNVARTVIANNYADCHIALHYDYTENDKGLFYISVPDVASYRSMEPVASHWKEHQALGEAILSGMRHKNVKIFDNGAMAIDLTQTSYSTIPSIDLEVGDRASDLSQSTRETLSAGLVDGLDQFFGE